MRLVTSLAETSLCEADALSFLAMMLSVLENRLFDNRRSMPYFGSDLYWLPFALTFLGEVRAALVFKACENARVDKPKTGTKKKSIVWCVSVDVRLFF